MLDAGMPNVVIPSVVAPKDEEPQPQRKQQPPSESSFRNLNFSLVEKKLG
jgi:hypothetical protein